MEIRSKDLTPNAIREIVKATGRLHGGYYGENIAVESIDPLHRDGTGARVKLGVNNSRGPGARISASGRHGLWACWHVFRDVIADILTADPDAIVRTALERYTLDNFNSTYPATGWRNVGSIAAPRYMPNLCSCPASVRAYTPNLNNAERLHG